MDICPKAHNGKHKPRVLAAFGGDPRGEITEVFCENCGKTLRKLALYT